MVPTSEFQLQFLQKVQLRLDSGIKKVWEVDSLLCPYGIPVPARNAHRVADQRRADRRASCSSCDKIAI